jgi:hypothetical protein
MNTRFVLLDIGAVVGFILGCPFNLPPIPSQCWCGEQWRAQISGATAYSLLASR